MELSKKEKKKEYNKNYLNKKKEQVIEEIKEEKVEKVESKQDVRKIIKDEMDFFFRNQNSNASQKAATPPQPIIIQPAPSSLKNKVLETLAITSLGLIPLIFKAVFQARSNNMPQEPQQKPTNTQPTPSTDMSFFS